MIQLAFLDTYTGKRENGPLYNIIGKFSNKGEMKCFKNAVDLSLFSHTVFFWNYIGHFNSKESLHFYLKANDNSTGSLPFINFLDLKNTNMNNLFNVITLTIEVRFSIRATILHICNLPSIIKVIKHSIIPQNSTDKRSKLTLTEHGQPNNYDTLKKEYINFVKKPLMSADYIFTNYKTCPKTSRIDYFYYMKYHIVDDYGLHRYSINYNISFFRMKGNVQKYYINEDKWKTYFTIYDYLYVCTNGSIIKEEKQSKIIDENAKECHENPCHNRGECLIESDRDGKNNSKPQKYSCKCSNEFFGHYCQYKKQCLNCSPENCSYNKKCKKCNPGWTGIYCNEVSCEGLEYCKNEGLCIVSGKKRRCICSEGYEGKNCKDKKSKKMIHKTSNFLPKLIQREDKIFSSAIIKNNKIPNSHVDEYEERKGHEFVENDYKYQLESYNKNGLNKNNYFQINNKITAEDELKREITHKNQDDTFSIDSKEENQIKFSINKISFAIFLGVIVTVSITISVLIIIFKSKNYSSNEIPKIKKSKFLKDRDEIIQITPEKLLMLQRIIESKK